MADPFSSLMLTVTIKPGAVVPLPAGAKDFASYRLVLSRPEGGVPSAPKPAARLVWDFGPLTPGDVFSLAVDAVDSAGASLAAYPAIVVTVPNSVPVGMYPPIGSVAVSWSAPKVL